MSAVPARRPAQPGIPNLTPELLHLFCHDLRVPLSTISACAELISSGRLPDAQREEFSHALVTQLERVSRMIDDLEGMCRTQDESEEFEFAVPEHSPYELHRAIGTSVDAIAPLAGGREVQLKVQEQPDRLETRVPEDVLAHALAWVLEMAVRRVPKGSCVTISSARRSEQLLEVSVQIPAGEVSDMEAAALARFEPGPAPPDLVRGIAGPFWIALHNLGACGAVFDVTPLNPGLRWTLVLPA